MLFCVTVSVGVVPVNRIWGSHLNSIIQKICLRKRWHASVRAHSPVSVTIVQPSTPSVPLWITLHNQLCVMRHFINGFPLYYGSPPPCPLPLLLPAQFSTRVSPQWATWLGDSASSRLTFTVNLIVSLVNLLGFPRWGGGGVRAACSVGSSWTSLCCLPDWNENKRSTWSLSPLILSRGGLKEAHWYCMVKYVVGTRSNLINHGTIH